MTDIPVRRESAEGRQDVGTPRLRVHGSVLLDKPQLKWMECNRGQEGAGRSQGLGREASPPAYGCGSVTAVYSK